MRIGSTIRALADRPVIRCLALVVLFTMWARFEPLASAILDPDLWWHLRGGDAIFLQHAVPHHGVFTRHVERPWIEYSWGFEVVVSRIYHWFGLLGLVALRSSLELIISAILFVIVFRGLNSFWQAWGLTAVGMWAIHHCLGLQPMLSTIVMFTLEIALIFEARRRGTARPLYLLPFVFVLWANLHIQFIYGIFVLVLLSGFSLIHRALPTRWSSEPELSPRDVLLVTAFSIMGTLAGPYAWNLYAVVIGYVRSSFPYMIITELQALNFRSPEHFVLVLVLLGSFFAIGWRRSRDPFKLTLLTICTLIGLRMTRDSWFACIPAIAVIGDKNGVAYGTRIGKPLLRQLAFVAITAVAIAVMFTSIVWDSKLTNAALSRVVEANFPADACEFIRAHGLRGPLYNDMDWGGYLIWALPDEPVAIDNRTDLYGDEILSRSYLVRSGFSDWRSDSDLQSARLVFVKPGLPLAISLFQDSHFKLVYQDRLAAVFTHDVNSVELTQTPESQINPVPKRKPISP